MSNQKIAFLFPGQGAQIVEMGKDFYENFAEAREVFQQGDEILGRNLSDLIFNGPLELLTETRNSQTAIYLNSIAILRVLEKQFPDLQPSVCAGLSLGEYTAITASGRICFEKCLELVQFRGEAMNEACERTKGTMAAIFGLSVDEIEEMVLELDLPKDLWVANFNCPGQTVISGTIKGVEKGMEAAKMRGAKRAIPLKVHGAFHSGLMKLAEEKLSHRINAAEISESSIQLVMNVPGNFVSNLDAIRLYLIEQVSSPVRWEQGIRAMDPTVDLYLEIGCGKTLSGMNKQIGVRGTTVNISKVQDLESMGALV